MWYDNCRKDTLDLKRIIIFLLCCISLTCYANDKAKEKAVTTEESKQGIVDYRLKDLHQKLRDLQSKYDIYNSKIITLEAELKAEKEAKADELQKQEYFFRNKYEGALAYLNGEVERLNGTHSKLLTDASLQISTLQFWAGIVAIIVAIIGIAIAIISWSYARNRKELLENTADKVVYKILGDKSVFIKELTSTPEFTTRVAEAVKDEKYDEFVRTIFIEEIESHIKEYKHTKNPDDPWGE